MPPLNPQEMIEAVASDIHAVIAQGISGMTYTPPEDNAGVPVWYLRLNPDPPTTDPHAILATRQIGDLAVDVSSTGQILGIEKLGATPPTLTEYLDVLRTIRLDLDEQT